MSRIISSESAGTQRTQLCRAIAIALRELAGRQQIDAEARDMAAFVALALRQVEATVDRTVLAWEKRDYWLKADQFRNQWAWAGAQAERLTAALTQEDWKAVAAAMAALSEKLPPVKLPRRNTLGQPWRGAYRQLVGRGRGDLPPR